MNKDTVVGILGAVILVAAMVAIFYYEGTQAPGTTTTGGGGGTGPLTFTWQNRTADGPSVNGQTAEGETSQDAVTIEQQNLTRVTFRLTWTDENVPQNQPDRFLLRVTSPDNQTEEAEGENAAGQQGLVEVTFSPLNQVPGLERGTTADLARLAGTIGMGEWRIEVQLLAAGDPGAPGVPPLPGQLPVADTGNAWELATELNYYEAQVSSA